jgi:flagellar biosynthesis/type III secretory pathway chaperone
LVEPAEPDLHQRAQTLVVQLSQMLEMEFDALKVQNLDEFERLQPVKNDLLSQLTAIAPSKEILEEDPQWGVWLEGIAECRDKHRRNAVLMERKLESIRGALDSLRLPGNSSGVEIYDRLGHVSRFSRGRGYNEA